MVRIAVVILNWNGRKYLEQFLPPLIRYSSREAEIIVADNASKDDSIAFLETNYPDVRIIRNNSNEGFARGYNLALKQVDADYYILLNSDIEVTPNWISPVIEMMENDQPSLPANPRSVLISIGRNSNMQELPADSSTSLDTLSAVEGYSRPLKRIQVNMMILLRYSGLLVPACL